jgi:hypothetical protein
MATLEELKAQYRRKADSRASGVAERPALSWEAAGKAQDCPGYPLVLAFPAEARMALIHGQWRRLADGRMRATFNSHAELLLCLAAVGRICAWNEGS